MGSRRRALRLALDENLTVSLSDANEANGFSSTTRLDGSEDRLITDNFIARRRRSSHLVSSLHPILTDFGPSSLSQYLEQELVNLRQLAARVGHQQEQELKDFARALVNSKTPISSSTQAGHKTFQIVPQEDALTAEKGKKPLRKQKEWALSQGLLTTSDDRGQETECSRSLRSSVRRGAVKSRTTPAVGLTSSTESLSMPQARQLRQTEQRRSRTFRTPEAATESILGEAFPPIINQDLATSFETHASQSRDTSRSDERVSDGGTSKSEARRRRKTPVQAHSSLARSIWASSRQQPGPIVESFDGPADSWQASLESDYVSLLDSLDSPYNSVFGTDPDTGMHDVASEDDLDAQAAIMASITETSAHFPGRRSQSRFDVLANFDYSTIVPEHVPEDPRQARLNRSIIWQSHGFDENGRPSSDRNIPTDHGPFSRDQVDPSRLNWLGAPDVDGNYPRKLSARDLKMSSSEARRKAVAPKTGLSFEIWEADTGKSPGGVLHYLSSAEIRTLRLVCKSLAEDLEPYVFRNVVTKFTPQLFSLQPIYSEDGKLELDQSQSMLDKFGAEMNKFGITFDYDELGLASAPYKVTEKVVDAWFGRYTWPVRDYPYFVKLREIDKLLDDERRLLTIALKKLTNCQELAVSLDSGHGWLCGPDISDLALYREQARGGSRVFARTYDAIDQSYEDGMNKLFEWAQRNTLNENLKFLAEKSTNLQEECKRLRLITIRDYNSFRDEKTQPDFVASLHTGGVPGIDQIHWTPQAVQAQAQAHVLAQATIQTQAYFLQNANNNVALLPPQGMANPLPRRFAAVMGIVQANTVPPISKSKESSKQPDERIQPQWPIIFNGYNVAAECRGDSAQIQSRLANPIDYPLHPSSLSEPQAQWLMETSWIQKSFLSAYMDAVRLNTHALRNVHSLHLSKISSGLLPQLLQKEFWSCLKGLRKVTLLVKPDWRVEHTPGDKFFQTNMPAEPITAAYKFADVLKDCIAPLENLNSLHIGYLGGGEHQAGIFGRNQHVLPAPITQTPRSWLIAQNSSNPKPHSNTIIAFPHVRTLRFENCWFSPLMLEEFMLKSRDSSLHNLILDSVSLTAQVNSTRTDGPLRTVDHNLKCQYGLSSWLNESLPVSAAWSQVLDKITPGKTLLDQKYDEGMIDEEQNPRPEPSFRGNIQQITLKSCGYVKILGVASNDFNQNELVYQHTMWSAMDDGLKLHANKFMRTLPNDNLVEISTNDSDRRGNQATLVTHALANRSTMRVQPKESARTIQRPIMLSGRPAHMRSETISTHDENSTAAALTGYLTQCIHPVEKRILEQNWGMKFGWGNDMQRWEAVEDGWFMGGTGRFEGDVFKDHALQEAVPRPVEEAVLVKDTTYVDLTGEHTDEDESAEGVRHPPQLNPSSRSLLTSDFFDDSSESEAEAEASQAPGSSRRRRRVRLRFPARRNRVMNLETDRGVEAGEDDITI